MSSRNLIIEPILVTLSLLAVILLLHLHPVVNIPGGVGHSLTALIWILVPWSVLTIRKEPFMEFGLHTESFSRSLSTGLVASLLILTPYFILYSILFGDVSINAADGSWIMKWIKMSLYQIFYIALPEEFFFRGYLQTRLNQLLGRPFTLWGGRFGWGLPVASLIFVLFHLVFAINLWNLGVLFPALIFGWLREKTGSITASTVFHALSNIALFTLQNNF
jgi:membrane protease YdiL (CAAX protease family)